MTASDAADVRHFRVSRGTADRFAVPAAFWKGLQALGISPAELIRRGGLPLSAFDGERCEVSTAQFFAVWRTLGELRPAAGIELVDRIEADHLHPAAFAALHARGFGDGLTRLARYKQLCCAEEMHLAAGQGSVVVEVAWPFANAPAPAALTDATFSAVVELARRGMRRPWTPERVLLQRPAEPSGFHAAYFGCRVSFGSPRNQLVIAAADLDVPFATHNEDLVNLLVPQLERQLAGRRSRETWVERVRWVLERLLPSGGPDIDTVAKELRLGARTLQRRIVAEGTTFRQLVHDVRRERVRQYLGDPSIGIAEAAFLLGYDDPNAFYRAFRRWEGTTPARWRERQRQKADAR
ncbi:MAG TPA: AraC family transcriptional regulator ligand-binding domain-containing protein [Tahibacter sp.]|nr:AraC family transcriptional regulator ligand-binding domain-containing protein [Tahibacter sp.]